MPEISKVKKIHRRLTKVKVCPFCKKEFHPFSSLQKFCSQKCLMAYRYEIKLDTNCTKPKKCPQCGEDFKPSNFRNRFCSRTCFIKHETKTKEIKCATCGKPFQQIRKVQKFCSRECSNPYKDRVPKKTKNVTLDNLWRDAVKFRAGMKCEYCGKTTGLNSHHIFSRSNKKVRWDINNGICLCVLHHVFGQFSAHKSPLEFAEWLKTVRSEKWYCELLEKARFNAKYIKMTKEDTNLLRDELKSIQNRT